MRGRKEKDKSQLAGAGLFGEASMSGLEALLGSALGQANLMGNVGTGLLSGAISGAGKGQGGMFSGFGGVANDVAGLGVDLVTSALRKLGLPI
jgi:hypothetical protein